MTLFICSIFLGYLILFTSNIQNQTQSFLFSPKKSDRKIITISSCGTRGYYLLGITSYLKDHFDLSDHVYSGASAGSWISLIMSYRGNHTKIIQDVLRASDGNKSSVKQLGKGLKNMFLTKYQDQDFDLNACYMGVIDINAKKGPRTLIYNNFTTLEDAVNCCIASSHVPFVMGNFFRKYRDRNVIDGGFSNNPYYGNGHVDGNCEECEIDRETRIADLHIHPFIWYKRPIYFMEFLGNQFKLFLDLFFLSSMNFTKMYEQGYEDAKRHHANFRHFTLKPRHQYDSVFHRWW